MLAYVIMTIAEKLKGIKRATGLTQQQLANIIGVTFVAFNRWINSHTQPQYFSWQKINGLYEELSEIIDVQTNVIQKKEDIFFKI